MTLMHLRIKQLSLVLLLSAILPSITESKFEAWKYSSRVTNWTALVTQPAAFVARAQLKLRKRPEGYKPSSTCANYVALSYLENIRKSRYSVCRSDGVSTTTREHLPETKSAVDCYTAPFVRVGNSTKASVSLCHSRNLVLDSCSFLEGQRKGTLSKKFPLPSSGAVRLACAPVNTTRAAESGGSKLQWLNSIHHDVWWANATRDEEVVRRACAPNSTTLVTTPTLFVMRDRHANYAHEMEVVSMAFSFLAALEAKDAAKDGLQVVIVDKAPATGFLETWARISRPHRLRILANEPFPPDTCFRSAYHVYTFAAGIGYNTNHGTVRCESPVVTGLSNWLRQLYGEGDLASRKTPGAISAAAVAGPAAEAAGVRGLRPPAGGIVLKNVVWLSRRNLEIVRMLLNASVGWKSMRLVRNEDEVVAGIMTAVQEWNAESCLLRRFERTVKQEYDRSLTAIHPVHAGAIRRSSGDADADADADGGGDGTLVVGGADATNTAASSDGASATKSGAAGLPAASSSSSSATSVGRRLLSGLRSVAERLLPVTGRLLLGTTTPAGAGAAGQGAQASSGQAASNSTASSAAAASSGTSAATSSASDGAGGSASDGAASGRVSYMIGNNIVSLERLWEVEGAADAGCRRTNVFFKFVDGDFNDESYHLQLQTIFRTGVLVGVHGAGLTHGYFMQPGQSAVLQLLGTSYAKVAANNVFRNMAAGVGNYYEDVLYDGVDVDVAALKKAVKRSMDYVARKAMEAQMRREGALRLVLVDQSHFSIVMPPRDVCPLNASTQGLTK